MPAARGWCCCLPGAADEPKVLVVGLQGSGKTLLVQQLVAAAVLWQQKQSSSPVSSKHRLGLRSAAVAPLPCSDSSSSSHVAAQQVPAGPPPRTLPTIGTELQQCPLGFTLREVGGVMRQLWHHYYAEAAAVLFVVDAALPDPAAAAAAGAAAGAAAAAAITGQAAETCSSAAPAGAAGDPAQQAGDTNTASGELPTVSPAAAAFKPVTDSTAGEPGVQDTAAVELVPDDAAAPAAAATATAAATTAAAAGSGQEEAAEPGPSTATNPSVAGRTLADASDSTIPHAVQLQQPLADSTILPGAAAATEEAATATSAPAGNPAAAVAAEEEPGHSSVLPMPGCVTAQTSMQDGQQPAAAAAAGQVASLEQQQTHLQACGEAGGTGHAVFGCQKSKRPAVPLVEVLKGVMEHADLKGKPVCIVMNKTDMLGSQDRDKQLAGLSESLLAACCSKQQVQHDSSSEQSCSPEAPALQQQQKQQQQQQQQQQKQQPSSPRVQGITFLQTSAVSGSEVQALLQWLVCNSL